MTRYEFIENLKSNLSTLNTNVVNDKVKYYNDYIDAEVKKGRSETDVINELGDPRLIAKTIKEVSGEDANSINTNYDDLKSERDNFNRRYSENFSSNNQNNRRTGGYGAPYFYSTSGIGCVITGLVVFIIVYGILSLFGRVAVGSVRLMFASPIAFIAILGLLYYLFGRNRY